MKDLRLRPVTLLLAMCMAITAARCVIQETRDDILRQAWRCQDDVDCAPGWECRTFAVDPKNQGYCVKPCTEDADCLFGDVCSNEGFCLEPCDLTAPACRDPKYHCHRWNMTPGEQSGLCLPTDPCSSTLECGSEFDQCLSQVVVSATLDETLEQDRSTCIGSCAGKTCDNLHICLPDALHEAGLPSGFAPQVCVPSCGKDNSCPDGFRCLQDALMEVDPTGQYGDDTTKFCIPGLSGVGLPCRSDRDCLTGRCVRQPGSTLADGSPLKTCALPCDVDGHCATSNEVCLESEYQGQSMGFCFRGFRPCSQGNECVPPQQCFDMSHVGAGSICLEHCSRWREDCGGQRTCVADSTGNSFGCFPGYPGYPCASNEQCHQDLGEDTHCLAPPEDSNMTICTKECERDADCTFGILGGPRGYLCLEGICRAFAYPCGITGFPLECAAGMQCAYFFGDGQSEYQFCTVPCSGPREDTPQDPACPLQFTCANLLQSVGPPAEIESYCVQGLPGMMPCSRDSECWDSFGDGSQSCASLTGQPVSEVGTCSVPCLNDVDCLSAWGSDGVPVFCLPGAPNPDDGEVGQCFANPSMDVLLGPTPRYQGAFCGSNYGSPSCADGFQCVSPVPGGALQSPDEEFSGEPYCAKECTGDDDCRPQSPTPHKCVQEPGIVNPPSYCRPAHDPRGLPFWAECLDHRQCEWGLCYKAAPDALVGHCTRLCGPISGTDQGSCSDLDDARCPLTAPHVCKPTGVSR